MSTVKDDDGRAMFSIGQLEDITERKAFSDRLRYEAAHDVMTGLLNRASFSDRVAMHLADDDDSGRKSAVLFIDLDHFKLINDSLGHAAGDDLLVTVAQRLRHALRPGDLLRGSAATSSCCSAPTSRERRRCRRSPGGSSPRSPSQ